MLLYHPDLKKIKSNLFCRAVLISITFFWISCSGEHGKYMHILSAKAGDSIIYMQKNDTHAYAMTGEIEVGSTDSFTTLVVKNEGKEMKFTQIPADFLNQNCTVEFSKNEFKDYFPAEWALLKDAENFATLRVYVENGFFHLIVINSINGTEIARHAEKF